MVSREFLAALKLNDRPAYRIAQEAGVNPATLSKICTGCTPVEPGDERVTAVGALLGLTPQKCFAEPEVD